MSSLNGLQPWLRPWAEELLRRVPGGRVTSVYRSWTDQLRLWLNRHRNPLPVAPPGRSAHQVGRAFDVVWNTRDQQVRAGRLWSSWGGRWGGVRDPVHFEA